MGEIVTVGSGWYEQLGDQAELDVAFSSGTASTRTAAVADLGERVAVVNPLLDRPGVTVRHRALAVHDDWGPSRVIGCRAREDIALRITDVRVLGELVSALVAVEPAHVVGPRWGLADPVTARREAQRRAVADARDRAEGYAAALGIELGPLVRLSEGQDGYVASIEARVAADLGGPDITSLRLDPEPVRVTVQCTIAWHVLR